MLKIRSTTKQDFEAIMEIYRYAREQMRSNGNPNQWYDKFPEASTLSNDIDRNNSYVIEQDGIICGVFTFIIGKEPTYERIEGSWKNDDDYGTIHRIASNGKIKGIFDICLKFCENKISNIRIDTHKDNKIMQHLIEKNGFEKCGIIYVEDGSPRIAYQKTCDTNTEKKRCDFSLGAKSPSKTSLLYHDTRWCKPEHRDNELFAMLVLEGMQAGVSWDLILKKEAAFRRAFDGFDPKIVANYDEQKTEQLMNDKGIIRNRNKINAAITNARAFIKIQEEFGSFDKFIWSFTNGETIDHHLSDIKDMPTKNELSEKIGKELKKRGFKFVGATIIYSYLQGIGIINDHWEYCDYR